MVVSIASDHAGYELRQKVKKYLEEKGFEVLDGGAPNGTDSYSYVDAGIKVAEDVSSGKAERGIAICGTGIGISLVCNKYKGIRCAPAPMNLWQRCQDSITMHRSLHSVSV